MPPCIKKLQAFPLRTPPSPTLSAHLTSSTESSTMESPRAKVEEHPGFTTAIEIDHPMSTLTAGQRDDLLGLLPTYDAHIERAPLGNARVVFENASADWMHTGDNALRILRSFPEDWPIAGVEICRSDLWIDEPFFDHEPGGLGTLPKRSAQRNPRRESTVIVEVEPAGATTHHYQDTNLTTSYHRSDAARLSYSSAGRPQLIVEISGQPADAVLSIAKPAISISLDRTITRIRALRADLYRAEVTRIEPARHHVPEWAYVSDDDERKVVVTDLRVRLEGWSIVTTTLDGVSSTSDFSIGCVWRDDDGNLNLVGNGDVLDAWEAPIAPGSSVDAFIVDGQQLSVDPWDDMTEWLVEPIYGKPVGFLIELGPSDYRTDDEIDEQVVCAQIVFLDDGVMMLRRSRTVLDRLTLTDHSTDGLRIDTWLYDGHFEDCTGGYLFTRDIRLVARSCVTWFRDKSGYVTTDYVGCSYRTVDELPRSS